MRARLLSAVDVAFAVRPTGLNETALLAALEGKGASNAEKARSLAEAKARAVSGRAESAEALVIGADQVLDLDGQAFEAPETPEDAAERLRLLRGRSHHLRSGVALALGGAVIASAVESVAVTMRDFSDEELARYLAKAPAEDLAAVGGYALEGLGATLVAEVQGDWFTALGLPLFTVLEMLRRAGRPAEL